MGKHNDHVRNNWVLLSSADTDFLKGFLLAACRHLSTVKSEIEYAEIAIQYKLRYIQDLRRTILSDGPSSRREAVTRALVLAFDDVCYVMTFNAMAALTVTLDYDSGHINGFKPRTRSYKYHSSGRRQSSTWLE